MGEGYRLHVEHRGCWRRRELEHLPTDRGDVLVEPQISYAVRCHSAQLLPRHVVLRSGSGRGAVLHGDCVVSPACSLHALCMRLYGVHAEYTIATYVHRVHMDGALQRFGELIAGEICVEHLQWHEVP